MSTQQSEVKACPPSPERLGSLDFCEMPDFEYADDDNDLTCPHCGGSGGEPLDDGCTPCEHCDGEGYQYWL